MFTKKVLVLAVAGVLSSLAYAKPSVTLSLSVKITFATLSVLHGVVKHAIFAGVYR